ncbi:MAG: serine hydrolase [Bacteroidales bacterium]
MKSYFSFIICLLLIARLGIANPPSQQLIEQKLDSLVGSKLQPAQPGGVLGLIYQGEPVFSKSYGMADIQNEVTNSMDIPFNLASVSKNFTAFAILLLEKQGKIDLDDPIHKYLPELPDYGHVLTIRHLVSHTNGLAPTDNLRLFAGRSLEASWSQQDELEMIFRYPTLNFVPGEQYSYSNAGYSLLAAIIEKASGMSYSEYLKEMIFDPLNMNNTYVYDRPNKPIPGKAKGYKKEEEDFVPVASPGESTYGSTNIYTTANDMIRWGNNYFQPEVGDAEMLQKIFTPAFTTNDGDTINYTYGMMISEYKGMQLVSHSGGDIGYRTQFLVFPEHQVVVFAMFNTEIINTRSLVNAMADWYLEDFQVITPAPERIAREADPLLLKKYEGTYRMDDGMELSFALEQDTFWLMIPEAPKFELFSEKPNHFFLKAFEAQVTFIEDEQGEVNEIIWHQGGTGYPAARATEVVMPDQDELIRIAGIYYHETLDVEYPIEYVDGQLVLTTPPTFKEYLNLDKVVLVPMGDDRFLSKDSPLGVLEFFRSSDNEFTGFQFKDVGRLKNIAFIKTR